MENVQLTTSNPGGVNDLNIGAGITTATGFSFYSSPGRATDDSGNVTLWLFPNSYNFIATPQSGSITSSTRSITMDTNFTITMEQPVTFSGYLRDALGNALPNQNIRLDSGAVTVASTTTDINGYYSLSVAPGTYNLFINFVDSSNLYNVAKHYSIRVNNYVLNQNTENQNLTLPFKMVEVHVQNAAGQAVSNMPLITNNPGGVNDLDIGGGITTATGFSFYGSPGKSTDNNGNATLWLFTNNYTVTATPPSGSPYSITSAPKNVTANTNLLITMQKPITVSGILHDALGNSLPNQNIRFDLGSTTVASTVTNSSGFFSLLLTAGTYDLFINYVDTDGLYNIAQNYTVRVNNYFISDNISNLNLTLPMRRVNVHIQDPQGQAIGGIKLTTNNPGGVNDLDIGSGITNATGFSFYGDGVNTDTAGNAILWLFTNTYNLIATPQQDSIYSIFTLNDVSVVGNQAEIISLQYNHAPPVTVATLQTDNGDGTYSDPTTVTLSATADTGYTIADTFYAIDGGSRQTYTVPFTVSDAGEHTITYWSVDNSGVAEAPNSQTFTIYENQPPSIDLFPGATIKEGEAFTASSTFSDPDSTSWTATVDYGDIGGSPEPLPLNPDKTFSLSHTYNTAGVYDVAVIVTDDEGNTGMTTATVTVQQLPQIAALSGANINQGDTYNETGSFSDSDSTFWTATVDYGVGTGAEILVLNGTSFDLSHTYQTLGEYTLTIQIHDSQGNIGTETATVTVANVAPTVGAITASLNPIQVNTATTASASFTDAGILDTHTAVWDWGDGATSNGTVTENDGSGSISDSHTYTAAGVYEITLTVTDNNGGQATKVFQYLTVFDQSAGWVAGSKEFNSPAGTVAGNPTITGTVDFGFQVKYKQGDMVPSGKNLEFSFPQANLTFTSTTYQWLVIDGAKATFKATGTLNGTAGSTILVSALDTGNGQQKGLIRIQIKDQNNTVIYDTQPGASDTTDPITSVTKGKIAVH